MSGAQFARLANDILKAATGIDAKGKAAATKVGKAAQKTDLPG